MNNKITSITNWLIDNYIKRNVKGFIIDFASGSLPETLAVLLCSKTRRDCYVFMDKDSHHRFFINKYNSSVHIINFLQCTCSSSFDYKFDKNAKLTSIASEYNLLIVKPYDIIEIKFIRPWGRFLLSADLLPFANLTKKEIEELYCFITDLEGDYNKVYLNRKKDNEKYSKEIDFTYSELEWALEANSIYDGIIEKEEDPTRHPKWFSLTVNQKKIIAFLHQHSKLTEHKFSLPKVF